MSTSKRPKPTTDELKEKAKLAKTTASLARKIEKTWLNPEHAPTYDDKPMAARQYRVMSIPNPLTKLNLGEWVSNPAAVGLLLPFGYPGISMETVGNFYARMAARAVFQVNGATTFQTADQWTQFAKGFDVTVEEKTTLASGASITIAAGPKGKYEPPPSAGRELSPPSFDKSGVNSLLLDHFAADDDFLISSVKEMADLHKQLGLAGPEAPAEKIWKTRAVRFHALAQKAAAVKKKIGKVQKFIEATSKGLEVADRWWGANSSRAEATLDDAAEKKRQIQAEIDAFKVKAENEDDEARLGVAENSIELREANEKEYEEEAKKAGASAPATAQQSPDEQKKSEEKKQKLANANQYLTHLGIVVDQVDRLMKRGEKHCEKISKAAAENQESVGQVVKATALAATVFKSAEGIAQELESMLDEHAAEMVLGQGDPKIFVAAKDALQLSSGKEITAYATEGFRVGSDKGGLLLHTTKALEARSLAAAELTAKDNLLLQGHKGAELTSKGPVAVGSRESEVEVIAPKIRLGTLDPATAQRKKQDAALGGTWTDGKQKPTTHLMGAARELVTLQAGGKAPGGEELKLDAEMPAAVALRAQEESAEVWAKKKIVVEADESSGEVRLNVGKFVLTITAKKAVLGLASDRGEVASTALLSVDDKGEVRAETKGARLHLKEKGGSFAMRNGDSHVSVGPTGTKANGGKIQIG